MLESLLGSTARERVLIYLLAREEGYARQIADYFGTSLRPTQTQLEKMEAGGILYSRPAGKTRLFAFNPRYPFLAELRALLEKALSFYPEDQRDALLNDRRRPRRTGKPL